MLKFFKTKRNKKTAKTKNKNEKRKIRKIRKKRKRRKKWALAYTTPGCAAAGLRRPWWCMGSPLLH
jgi:hypothetical protein